MSLYEQVLRGIGDIAGLAVPPKPPRTSAAVVLWRRAGAELEVFWVRRSQRLAFMAGWYAFPGGAVERSDTETLVSGTPRCARPDAVTAQPEGEVVGADLAPGVVAGALRELEEETGLRVPDASDLVFAGRWLTPPLGPIRFDNRFFLLEWPANRPDQPRVEPGELEFGEWIAPARALELWQRGRALAAPPVLHLLRVLADAGPEAGLPRLLQPDEANLGSFRIIEFRPGFLVFPVATPTLPPATHTNAVLAGIADSVLIDPGSPDEGENRRLARALVAAGERLGRRVTRIVLTHHHPDHVGGVEAMRQAFGVPVAAHAATAERLADRGNQSIRVDELLADGDQIRLSAMTLDVVHTPGHARGHLVLHDAERRLLVAGDLVSALSTIVIDPPEGDLDDYLASLARVAELDATLLIPAHGSAMLEPPVRLREAIAHRHGREAKIVAALERGLQTVEELLDAAYDDTPAQVRPLAARQLQAHLDRLARRGG